MSWPAPSKKPSAFRMWRPSARDCSVVCLRNDHWRYPTRCASPFYCPCRCQYNNQPFACEQNVDSGCKLRNLRQLTPRKRNAHNFQKPLPLRLLSGASGLQPPDPPSTYQPNSDVKSSSSSRNSLTKQNLPTGSLNNDQTSVHSAFSRTIYNQATSSFRPTILTEPTSSCCEIRKPTPYLTSSVGIQPSSTISLHSNTIRGSNSHVIPAPTFSLPVNTAQHMQSCPNSHEKVPEVSVASIYTDAAQQSRSNLYKHDAAERVSFGKIVSSAAEEKPATEIIEARPVLASAVAPAIIATDLINHQLNSHKGDPILDAWPRQKPSFTGIPPTHVEGTVVPAQIVSNDNFRFRCNICSFQRFSQDELTSHLKSHASRKRQRQSFVGPHDTTEGVSEKNKILCGLCDMYFTCPASYHQHVQTKEHSDRCHSRITKKGMQHK